MSPDIKCPPDCSPYLPKSIVTEHESVSESNMPMPNRGSGAVPRARGFQRERSADGRTPEARV
jgi:hypothetical protein